ncbi:MAG TPA: ATP-binding protein, partial [Pirellulaceae bacterium]|nr:ATP-binding protein [Pirellulaceae bacterium]
VLLNLLSNAVKFTERGSIRIGAARHSCEGGRMQLQLFVADTGPGIPETKRELIFHAFEQADHSITRRHGGTGLGLAICSRLVKMMGGRIWVESEVGAGSTFYFTTNFDLERPSDSANATRSATTTGGVSRAAETPSAPAPTGSADASRVPVGTSRDRAERSLRVLLVEDEDVNREVAIRILGRRGHLVTATPSGRHALEAWSADPAGFDVLITDISMPEVGGIELTRQIREREAAATSQRRLPIVAMTASAMKGDAERFMSFGMDGYVAKPISRDAFVRTIEAAACSPRRPDEGASPSNPPRHGASVDLEL